MTAEGITRALAKMIRWATWERNVLILNEGSLESNGQTRFNEKFSHLALKHEHTYPEIDARVAGLRKKWAHTLAPTRKIQPLAARPQQYDGHFFRHGSPNS